MTETEVERLVVRLVGDSTSYVKMLTDAQKKTDDAVKKVEQAAGRIEKFQKNLEGFAATTKSVLGAIGITATLKGMYEQFDKADDTITELTAIIQANGREVTKVLPLYQQFAKEMAAVTEHSKGEIIEMAKQTESLGLSGERAQKAIKNAITLGAIKGTDPSSFLRQTVNFEKTGNAAGIARVLGLIGEMEEDTTKAAEAAKLLERNWALVTTKGEDGGARINRALNEMKSLGKDAGEVISRNFEPLIVHLESVAREFKEIDPAVRKTIATLVVLTATIYPAIVAYGILASKILAVAAALKAVSVAAAANPFAAAAIIALTVAMVALNYQMNKYNEAVSKGKELSANVFSNQSKQMEQMDPSQKQKNMASYEDQLKKAKDDLERMQNKSVGRPGMSTMLPGMVGVMDLANKHLFGGSEEIEEQKQKIKELQEIYDAYVADRNNAQKSANTLQAGPSKETIESIRQLNDSLNTQMNTLGMTETEAKIYELRMKAVGDQVANADLDIAEYNARMLDAAKAQRSAIDSAKDLIKSMEFQIKTWGMSESAALRYKLTMEGVDDATIDRAVALQEELEGMEAIEEAWNAVGESVKKTKEQYQALNGVAAGSADAAALIYQYSNQFGADTGAVNRAATIRATGDFKAQRDPNFLGAQVKGSDATKELEKKLDDQTKILQQIRDKESIEISGADLIT